MTEQEWLSATQLVSMLDYLRTSLGMQHSKKGRRKIRLFGCACCRSLLHLLEADHPGRLFLEGAERHADDLINKASWARAERAYYEWHSSMADRREGTMAIHSLGLTNAFEAAENAALYSRRILAEENQPAASVEQPQCCMLRHIFGNPFSTHSPGYLSATVVALAQSLYQVKHVALHCTMPCWKPAMQNWPTTSAMSSGTRKAAG